VVLVVTDLKKFSLTIKYLSKECLRMSRKMMFLSFLVQLEQLKMTEKLVNLEYFFTLIETLDSPKERERLHMKILKLHNKLFSGLMEKTLIQVDPLRLVWQ